jgi:hypothetical protein
MEDLLSPLNDWIKKAMLAAAWFGIGVGALSLFSPERSIKLYQGIMRLCNWRVEPLDYKRELWNTKVLGAMLIATSALMAMALVRPEWFVLAS